MKNKDRISKAIKDMEKPRWIIDLNEEFPLAIIEDTDEGMGVLEIGKSGQCRAEATPEQWALARKIVAMQKLPD